MAPDDRTAYYMALDERVLRQAEGHIWASDTPIEERAVAVASALASSPAWNDLPDATMLVRAHAPPAVVVAGRFGDAEAARLESLRAQLEQIVSRTRYRAYQDVEADCAALADRLLDRVGPTVRTDYRLVGIPRGGHVVAGLLSYCLDVPASRCGGAAEPGECLLVVDDCAISGARFRDFLSRSQAGEVVFGQLWSPAPLRAAIEEAEPRVTACVSGRNTTEVGRSLPSEEYEAWRHRWEERPVDSDLGYWWGLTEHVCFPWNEPDIRTWNEVTRRIERGWRVIPPARCLENRVTFDSDRLQLQPRATGPLRPAEDVVFGGSDDGVLVARRGAATCWRLDGSAGDIWEAMVERGTREGIVEELSRRYDGGAETLRSDAETFLDRLIELGLVVGVDTVDGDDEP